MRALVLAILLLLKRVVQSITPLTGALAGGLGISVPILAAVTYEMRFGRPSSTAGLAIPFGIIYGALGAAVGGGVGFAIQELVKFFGWRGSSDRRVGTLLVVIAVAGTTTAALYGAARAEAAQRPRVMTSTGALDRSAGEPTLVPVREASFVWVKYPHPDYPVQTLLWNGQPVHLTVTERDLTIAAGDRLTPSVNIAGFDYVREVYGVTATLSGGSAEWLALLLQLRATGRRDLLLVLNPDGVLVHEELLDRYRGGGVARVGLAAAGARGTRQELSVDRGTPIRYSVLGPNGR
jgi:hypothetical protein